MNISFSDRRRHQLPRRDCYVWYFHTGETTFESRRLSSVPDSPIRVGCSWEKVLRFRRGVPWSSLKDRGRVGGKEGSDVSYRWKFATTFTGNFVPVDDSDVLSEPTNSLEVLEPTPHHSPPLHPPIFVSVENLLRRNSFSNTVWQIHNRREYSKEWLKGERCWRRVREAKRVEFRSLRNYGTRENEKRIKRESQKV